MTSTSEPPSHDYHRTSMTEVNRANRTLQWKVDESSMNNWDLNFKNGNRLAKSIQSTRMGSSDAHNYLHWCWLCGSDDVGCVAPWCYVNLLCGSTMWIDWCWLCDSSDSSDWCRCTILMSRMLDAADDLVAIMSTISFEKAHSNECIQRTLPIQQAQSNKPSPTQQTPTNSNELHSTNAANKRFVLANDCYNSPAIITWWLHETLMMRGRNMVPGNLVIKARL